MVQNFSKKPFMGKSITIKLRKIYTTVKTDVSLNMKFKAFDMHFLDQSASPHSEYSLRSLREIQVMGNQHKRCFLLLVHTE